VYINLETRTMVDVLPTTDAAGYVELIIDDMPGSDPAYYVSSDDFYDVDTDTSVTRYVKVEHYIQPALTETASTVGWGRAEWIANGNLLYIKNDPVDLTDTTLYNRDFITTSDDYRYYTNYRSKHVDTVRAEQVQTLTNRYIALRTADIEYMNHVFVADLETVQVLGEILATGIVPIGFYWRAKDNTNVPMSYVELQGLAQTLVGRGMVAFASMQEQKMVL